MGLESIRIEKSYTILSDIYVSNETDTYFFLNILIS